MKRKFLLPILLVSGLAANAQRASQLYAVTAFEDNYQWLNIRLVDASKGAVVKTVFDYNNKQVQFVNANTNTTAKKEEGDAPTTSMVAAAAYQKTQSKFFFIPMRVAELRWADLSNGTPAYYTFSSPVLSKLNMNDEANHFTRMTIGADGNGYALTNDGNHLIQFTTGKETRITDLGNLVDASSNNGISIHNRCSSWGGDMVAAADGSLYIISQTGNVFQFSAKDRIVKHLGIITGLPQNFTTNGAAVTEEGDVIVACSHGNQPYYKVDINTFEATPAFAQTPTGMNTSDLASAYLVRKPAVNNSEYLNRQASINVQKISMYPNPVTEKKFQLLFDDAEKGEYTIQVLDLSGKVLLNKVVNIAGAGQITPLDLNSNMSKGVYMIKVTNREQKTVFSDKLMVQ